MNTENMKIPAAGRRRVAGAAVLGAFALLATLLVVIGITHVFAPAITEKEAENLVREFYLREAGQRLLDRKPANGFDKSHSGQLESFAAEMQNAKTIPIEVEIKKAWIVPPLAKRTTYYIKARRKATAATTTTANVEPEYFKTDGSAVVYKTSYFWWLLSF